MLGWINLQIRESTIVKDPKVGHMFRQAWKLTKVGANQKTSKDNKHTREVIAREGFYRESSQGRL